MTVEHYQDNMRWMKILTDYHMNTLTGDNRET